MDISLVAASPRDAPSLTELFLDARRASMPYLPEIYRQAETLAWMAGVVLSQNQTMLALSPVGALGFASLRGEWLDHLYVAPAQQRRGVGTLLLHGAKQASAARLQLHVFQRNLAARSFYERRGFRLIALREGSQNDENEPDALYEWRR